MELIVGPSRKVNIPPKDKQVLKGFACHRAVAYLSPNTQLMEILSNLLSETHAISLAIRSHHRLLLWAAHF
jgi:hypothetical protein